MQQFLTSIFGDNKILQYGTLAVVALVLLLLVLWGFRTLFSGRVRPAGGRNRQPRLGMVDAFDLDRQRQLIIVRRDGIEHLVMIGGPNDIVIESGILRGQAPSRERQDREAVLAQSLPAPTEQRVAEEPHHPETSSLRVKAPKRQAAAAMAAAPIVAAAIPEPTPAPSPIAALEADLAKVEISAPVLEPVIEAPAPVVAELPPVIDAPHVAPIQASRPAPEPHMMQPAPAAIQLPAEPEAAAPEASTAADFDNDILAQLKALVPAMPAVKAEPATIVVPPAPVVPAPAIPASSIPAPAPRIAPPARPSLSNFVPRPTFAPRSLTPMRPIPSRIEPAIQPPTITPPAPTIAPPVQIAAPHVEEAKPIALPEPIAPVAIPHVAETPAAKSAHPLDELEEEMARLLGRPVKLD